MGRDSVIAPFPIAVEKYVNPVFLMRDADSGRTWCRTAPGWMLVLEFREFWRDSTSVYDYYRGFSGID